MQNLINSSPELIILLATFIVFISAMSRFNNPQILLTKSSDKPTSWLDHLKNSLRLNPGQKNLLLRPARANTTAFRYRLYQFFYAMLAVLIYWMMYLPGISDQIKVIISWFVPEDLPNLINAGPLVIAAFVILILPNVPPFRWADIKIRSMLYDRALIPAQQLREISRLKLAPYNPPANLVERVKEIARNEGFSDSDITYTIDCPTTQSLWSKCAILVEQIQIWEADDHYKTAFAALKEPDSEKRSVDAVKQIQKDLTADARVCFAELRNNSEEKNEALINREAVFRANCRMLLTKIYSLLAGVSLHSHYSDHERIIQFGKLGFHLDPGPEGPIPDSNDLLMLTIILCTVLVLPLAYKLGPVTAVMIGAIMLAAVLTPIVLARLCPSIRERDSKPGHHVPNVVYPILSGVLAAFFGFLIFSFGGQFIEASTFCNHTGFARYFNCTYPWSFLHGGIAMLLAMRLSTGQYPDINSLQGVQRYRQWGNFKDAIICALGMLIITLTIVIPEMNNIRPDGFAAQTDWRMPFRVALVSFVLGFIVPTWYRAQNLLLKGDRRKDFEERKRFEQELELKTHGLR